MPELSPESQSHIFCYLLNSFTWFPRRNISYICQVTNQGETMYCCFLLPSFPILWTNWGQLCRTGAPELCWPLFFLSALTFWSLSNSSRVSAKRPWVSILPSDVHFLPDFGLNHCSRLLLHLRGSGVYVTIPICGFHFVINFMTWVLNDAIFCLKN